MTDTPTPVSPDVAAALRESAEAMRDVTAELRQLRPDVRRSVRTTRVAIALVAIVGVIAGLVGWWAFDSYRDGACQRGNDTRTAVVDSTSTAAQVAVDATARRIAGSDPAARAEASSIAAEVGVEVRQAVAADPKLAQRECG